MQYMPTKKMNKRIDDSWSKKVSKINPEEENQNMHYCQASINKNKVFLSPDVNVQSFKGFLPRVLFEISRSSPSEENLKSIRIITNHPLLFIPFQKNCVISNGFLPLISYLEDPNRDIYLKFTEHHKASFNFRFLSTTARCFETLL